MRIETEGNMKKLIILIVLIIVISGFGQTGTLYVGIDTARFDSVKINWSFFVEPETTITHWVIPFYDTTEVIKWFGKGLYQERYKRDIKPEESWSYIYNNSYFILDIPFTLWDSTWIVTRYHLYPDDDYWHDTLKWDERLKRVDSVWVHAEDVRDLYINGEFVYGEYVNQNSKQTTEKHKIYLGDAYDFIRLLEFGDYDTKITKVWQIRYYWNLSKSIIETYRISITAQGDTLFKRINN